MDRKRVNYEEKIIKAPNGMAVLLLDILLLLLFAAGFFWGIFLALEGHTVPAVILLVLGGIYDVFVGWILLAGIKVLKPNEALVLTLFGKYIGTLKGEGMFFVNPFCTAVNPAAESARAIVTQAVNEQVAQGKTSTQVHMPGKKLSLKTMTLNNDRQKINDQLGNPIIIGIAVIWRIENTAKAVFNVDNYSEFLSIQCDAALRNTVRMYPYDVAEDGDEKSLRGSSQEIADKLAADIQQRVEIAGLRIEEARITHLAYAPEIAAVMLQRQQASAIIDARKMIVEGAVGMVKMALDQLSADQIVDLDDERRAQMVSNLLVVLCGNRDAQPVVNSGSIY